MTEIPRSNVLLETPHFIVQKNGLPSIPIAEAKIIDDVKVTCAQCGLIQNGHTFHKGVCFDCIIKAVRECDGAGHMLCVSSTAFKEAAYKPDGGFLVIVPQNKNSDPMIYIDVPNDVWTGFLTAKSAGQYFNLMIKGKYTKL